MCVYLTFYRKRLRKALNKKLDFFAKMGKVPLSIIVPAYNEEEIISDSVKNIYMHVSPIKIPFEVLVVDDNSRDKTLGILKKIIKSGKYRNLRYVNYKEGPSRRENLAKSFRLLKGDYVLLLDMDIAMDLKSLKVMVQWLDRGYDIVLANRYHDKSLINRNPKRYAISKTYNAIIRLLFRTGMRDNVCGFKAFRKEVILRLVDEIGTDPTGKRSVFWDTQVIIYAVRDKFRIKDIPIHWKEGKKSALNFKRESKMSPYIIKFFFRYYFQKLGGFFS